MEIQTIRTLILADAVFMAVLCFGFLVTIAVRYEPGKAAVRVYRRVNQHLKEQKRGWFDYRKTEAFLRRNGAWIHLGQWVEPVKYEALKFVLAAAGIFTGVRYHILLGLILAVFAYVLPGIYLIYANNHDNQKMLPEIKLIYHALAVQIQSGVYMADALSECYNCVTYKRLKSALMELSGEILVKSNLNEALERFQGQFDNHYINSLSVILVQAMESGQAVELLSDISDQLKDMESTIMQKKKGKLDRNTTFYLLGIMAAILGVVIYVCVTEIFLTANAF